MALPASVREIADVIGRENALYLIGQLPYCLPKRDGERRVILYVPKRLKPDHRLVQILGWERAAKLVDGFGGEILQPANCEGVYLKFRNAEIARMRRAGQSVQAIAQTMGVCDRLIIELTREIPQEEIAGANDNRARE
jgi:hypothetical protein